MFQQSFLRKEVSLVPTPTHSTHKTNCVIVSGFMFYNYNSSHSLTANKDINNITKKGIKVFKKPGNRVYVTMVPFSIRLCNQC